MGRVLMGACSLPGVSTVCDVVGGAVGGAADSVFDAAAQKIAEGFAAGTRMVVTFWTGVTVPGLSTSTGPVSELRANTAWLSAFIAVLSMLVCAGRMAVSRSSRPASEAFKGLLILVVASGAGVAAVNALVVFGDEYSTWVLNRSTGGQLGARMAKLAALGSVSGLGAGLLLVVALLGVIASIAQIGLMLVRAGVVTIFSGLLPLAAAGTSTQTGMEYFKRICSWLLAFVLYKPAAATIYASAFLLIGDGTDATSVLSGMFMLILSIVALPAMLRLVTPMVGAAVAAGAGAGGGLAAAGMVLATGARMSGDNPHGRGAPPTNGGRPGLLPGGSGPGGPSGGAGPGGRPGSSGPSGGGAPAGAASAAGGAAAAAGPVVQAGVRVGQAATGAARGAASSTANQNGTAPTASGSGR